MAKKKTPVKRKKKTSFSNFSSSDSSTSKTKVRVIGIGGGGSSIVSEISSALAKVDFVAANTDKRALKRISKKTKGFQFGDKITGGLGTGMNPELGKEAASEEKEKIKKLLKDRDICIFVSCLGGGTGSGALPIFAKIAKDMGIVTYGIFTLPFNFEGTRKMNIALRSLEEVRLNLDTISVLPNENIFKIIDKNTPLKEALSAINKNLSESLRGLIETIHNPGLINIDFADLKTILKGKGRLAYLNTAAFDKNESEKGIVEKIISSPFYPYNIRGSNGVLLNVSGGNSLALGNVSKISGDIAGFAKRNAKVIFGISQSPKYEGKIRVVLLAVGCDSENIFPKQKKAQKPKKQKESPKKPVQSKPAKKKKTVSKKKKMRKPKKKSEIKIRRSGLEVKKVAEETEKNILEEEGKWETPAFLRRGVLDNNN